MSRCISGFCPHCGITTTLYVIGESDDPGFIWVQCQCAWYGKVADEPAS